MARKLFEYQGIRRRNGQLATGVTYVAYTDVGGTVLADISLTSGGSAIAGSAFTIADIAGLGPSAFRIYGPTDDRDTLYLRCPADSSLGVQEIEADEDERLDALEAGGGAGHPNLATHDSMGLATDAELTTHGADTTAIHGITDTAQLALRNAANTFTADNLFRSGRPWFDPDAFTGTDTAKLAAAFTAATGVAGAIVHIDRTYTVTGGNNLPDGVDLMGSGKITGSLAGDHLLLVLGNNTIQGVEFANTDTGGGVGNVALDLQTGASDVKILNCKFSAGIKTQAINTNLTGISDLLIQGNTFDGVGYGILCNANGNDINRVRIIGNTFRNIYTEAIALNHPGAAGVGVASPYEGGDHYVIQGNTISVPDRLNAPETGGFGISVAGANYVSIVGNVIEEAWYQGIHVEDETKHISIVGNVIHNVSSTSPLVSGVGSHGIFVIDADYLSIVGNQVYDCEDKGIWLEYAPGNQADQTVLSGNVVKGCGNAGIIASGDNVGHDLIVTDNISVDNGSHGIELRGNGYPATVDGNICRGNGGWGLRVESGRTGLILGQNQLVGNTSGDVVLANAGIPLILRGRRGMPTAVTDGGDTPFVTAFSLGLGAVGQLAVESFWVTNGTDRAARLYDLTWDGTTLVATSLASYTNSSMGAITVQQSGGNLQVACFYDNTGRTVQFDVQFTGQIMQGA